MQGLIKQNMIEKMWQNKETRPNEQRKWMTKLKTTCKIKVIKQKKE